MIDTQNCIWERVSDSELVCMRCNKRRTWTRTDTLPKRPCGNAPPPEQLPPAPNFGPGTEIAKLVVEIGGTDTSCGACKEMLDQMNRWGIAGCRVPDNREKILAQLRESAHTWSLVEWLAGGWRTMTGGLALDLIRHGALTDPCAALLDLALERAERLNPSTSSEP